MRHFKSSRFVTQFTDFETACFPDSNFNSYSLLASFKQAFPAYHSDVRRRTVNILTNLSLLRNENINKLLILRRR